jgi:hypothetical protein
LHRIHNFLPPPHGYRVGIALRLAMPGATSAAGVARLLSWCGGGSGGCKLVMN